MFRPCGAFSRSGRQVSRGRHHPFPVAVSTQAMAFGPERDARMIRKAEVNQGCPAGYHRGVGGICVVNPTDGPYKPDPYWTPCDYSLGPHIPRAVANSDGPPGG